MSNDGSGIERNAGIDMAPVGGFFKWNPGPDEGDPTLRTDFSPNLECPTPVLCRQMATDLKRLS